MKNRKEITDTLEDADKQRRNAHLSVEMEQYMTQRLMLEVLLDIRELLVERLTNPNVKHLD